MTKLTDDFHALYTGNPHEVKPKKVPQQKMLDEIEDCKDILRSNPKRITDAIYDGGKGALDSKQCYELGEYIAKGFKGGREAKLEAFEDLEKLFGLVFHDEAVAMAEETIDA